MTSRSKNDLAMVEQLASETAIKTTYQSPDFDAKSLSLITLGGSPGAGDSGAEGSENPFGSSSNFEGEESFDWDDDI